MTYRRIRKRESSKIEALSEAQKIAFAPLTFQALSTMLDLGILKALPLKFEEILDKLNLSEYTLSTLFDVALSAGFVVKNEETYHTTALSEAFLYDEMTKANFNFVKDVCYLGASKLKESFESKQPKGLHKFFSDSETIYPVVPKLPEQMKKSWYDFDHLYSNNCFEEILKIIFKSNPKIVYDIGGNTGNFEKACLKFNKDCRVMMFDLEVNKEAATKNVNSKKMEFHSIDVLKDNFPKMDGAIFMSQFLDCFSKKQIIEILKKVANSATENSRVYILEPFIDNQRYGGAAFALAHTSLYFTAMANGVSKMYNESDMVKLVGKSGLKVAQAYYDIGKYNYTFLECVKK